VGDGGKRGILATTVWIVVCGVALYLATAYLFLPALWTHRGQPG
jgi:type VI protein secretion system component VasF